MVGRPCGSVDLNVGDKENFRLSRDQPCLHVEESFIGYIRKSEPSTSVKAKPSMKIHGLYKGTVEKVTKHRMVSTFKEKGVLSVDEFVLAGDNLVSKCPT
ncbi:Autophagy-related protein 3 [Acorus calamus]|uniref:Autophagy-related protein 3 n=1 Tax=Acorus calamus TaxID=4465 RepID=A0AAV9CDB3_ACOCL|nr:Autophagy-related protein 3 [Acorus calamus]